MMKVFVAVTALALFSHAALAQEQRAQQQQQPAKTISQLINDGYEVKTMVILGGFSAILQKETSAYWCHTGIGNTEDIAQGIGAAPCYSISGR
jgi:hypothetical protein